GCGVRDIGRLVGRSASTISRELRRNAAGVDVLALCQLRNVCCETPTLSDASPSVRCPERISATTSRRNSSGYGGRVFGMDTTSFPLGRTDPSDQVSTASGAFHPTPQPL